MSRRKQPCAIGKTIAVGHYALKSDSFTESFADASFLVGMYHVLGYLVRIIPDAEQIWQFIEMFNGYGGSDFDNWLIIDIYDSGLSSALRM